MKKRIIAVFLAFCVFMVAFSVSKRVHAAGAAAVSSVVSIGLIAWELLDLMIKGEEPGIVVAMREFIESGIDGLTNPDSYFQQTYGDFWKDFGGSWDVIYSKLTEMYENGDIAIKNGEVSLTYEQYLDLYNIAFSFLDNAIFDFTTSYSYFAFDYNPGLFLSVEFLPKNETYLSSTYGESYVLFFYDDSRVIFADSYFNLKFDSSFSLYRGGTQRLKSDFNYATYLSTSFPSPSSQGFSYPSFSSIECKYLLGTKKSDFLHYFVFEDGEIVYKDFSSVDLSGCKTAIVSTTGDLKSFYKSIESVSICDNLADTLDDLSTVLPVDESPVLSIPTNPDLSVPIADQVTVSIPGATDVPISEYFDPVLTDIKAPTGLASKFPFCIPFDFVRFFGVLAADPIPPVIRIPISTHPANLEQFADNETIGDYVSPENPMFDIDEEIIIDFAHIPLVQPVCYTIFLVGFVIMLIKLTPKLIQH